MRRARLIIWVLLLLLAACAPTVSNHDTIASLRNVDIEVKEVNIEGGLEKAMQSYERFVEESPDSELTPEAIRRLADLKLEKEYGTLTDGASVDSENVALHKQKVAEPTQKALSLPAPEKVVLPATELTTASPSIPAAGNIPSHEEPEADFERRATQSQLLDGPGTAATIPVEGAGDLERPGTREAITLYEKLLQDYPQYKHNDQVLYQMSRAYEELGLTKEAMEVMDRMVQDVPQSRFIDEVQFRRAEYFFVHKHYLDAEDAYKSIVNIGDSSQFYELALYKLGWTFYKQELYEEALDRFIALLDHKVLVGYDFEQTEDEQERKRMEDTFRVVSLSFSSIGGANSVVEYFSSHGKRSYEDKVYSNLGEFYFDKRRYADAAATYNAFVDRNPFHKVAPNFHMRVIEIQSAGGFPTLVLESKKKFATLYGLKSEYWNNFDLSERSDVLEFLKTNLADLANHYHACYQDPNQSEDKSANFQEALHWYREFLVSFPREMGSPALNYQLASLLLENRSFGPAALEFEKTAYEYPLHEKSSQAGFAAVAAYREQIDISPPEIKNAVKRETVRSSLKFADAFPEHEKASIVLGAAADDLYGMKEYEQALAAATKLVEDFPDSEVDIVRDAWLVIGHSSYEIALYSGAESAYSNVLAMLPEEDEMRESLTDNLAASIYKQGEQANADEDYQTAADHFLRVGRVAPTSKIRVTAEYDAAAALIHLKDWEMAASVLVGFRNNFPENELQSEVTKKLAYVYRESDQFSLAANEYERIERESSDDEIRREALLVAAELHEKDGNAGRELEVYRRFVVFFPYPVEPNLETRKKIAEILKAQNDLESYMEELEQIVVIEASSESERTPRTRYLAAQAALVLAEQAFDAFAAVELVQPFEENLLNKRELMKAATEKFNKLTDYEIGETTAAATFYLAEIYAHFSKSLMTSERPEELSALELEQYELAIEEQAYPFEEKAIQVHESNLELMYRGIYNSWIEKSLQKLAKFVPARYDKPEENSGIISSLDTYVFAVAKPVSVEPVLAEESETPMEEEPIETVPVEEAEVVEATENVEAALDEEPEAHMDAEAVEVVQEEAPVEAEVLETVNPEQAIEPVIITRPETEAPAQPEGTEISTEPVRRVHPDLSPLATDPEMRR